MQAIVRSLDDVALAENQREGVGNTLFVVDDKDVGGLLVRGERHTACRNDPSMAGWVEGRKIEKIVPLRPETVLLLKRIEP